MRAAAVAALLAVPGLTASAAAAPAPHRCATAQLRVSVTHSGVAAGTVGGYLAFTNRGRSVCSLRGWPTVTALRPGASGRAVRVRETAFGPYRKVGGIWEDVRGVPTVTLRHGQAAVAAFTGSDVGRGPAGACPPPYRHLRVTTPGDATGALVSAWIAYDAQPLPSCGPIEVSMVVPASDLPPRG